MTDYRLTPREWREHDLRMAYYAALLLLFSVRRAPLVIVPSDEPTPF